MLKQEFLTNLRVARNLFVHNQVEADSPGIDAQAIEGQLVRAAIWLTPKSVKGFSAADFAELGPDRQRELSDALQEFLDVAQRVPPTAAPTTRAVPCWFGGILEGACDSSALPADPEEWRKTEDALKKVDYPTWVVNWDYEFGSDEDGVPVVWVTIFADEQTAPRKMLGRFATELSGKIHNALTAAGIRWWPYVRMSTTIEHKSA